MFGWLTGSSSSSSSPSPPDPTSAPTREDRRACWAGRDAYFACLDKNGVQVVGHEKGEVCAREKAGYEGSCARSWIDYFNKRRTLEIRQRLTLEAAERQRNENPNNAGR